MSTSVSDPNGYPTSVFGLVIFFLSPNTRTQQKTQSTEHSTEIYALHLKKNLKISSLTLWENAPPHLTVAPPPHCRAAPPHCCIVAPRTAPTAEPLKEKENGYGGKMEDEKRM
ncbi:hypothetical protein LR48_Vigan10g206900 [Vigna angularis]|uniref:Uncharacterized protein n=1 Tax=Phaseolus angularis TaxID=3914 RepID=A0A0L9VMQ2_PHAAN|nr:hypothetical protein LR48_Vigan10g206900 [Vigna angularis]